MTNYISFETFKQQAASYTAIPIYETLVFDSYSPLSAFYQFKDRDNYVFLEGVSSHEQHSRYSYLALDPFFRVQCFEGHYVFINEQERKKYMGNVYDAISHVLNAYTYPVDCPDFYTGLVGNLSYECAHHHETFKRPSYRELHTPDAAFMLPQLMLVFDKKYHNLTLVSTVFLDKTDVADEQKLRSLYDVACKRIQESKQTLAQFKPITPVFLDNLVDNYEVIDAKASISKSDFLKHVERCKTYIEEGDIFQIQVSRRLSMPYDNDPVLLYRYLRNFNPSPLLFNIKLANYVLVGASPEILVNVQDKEMFIRPIAGTRKRYSKDRSEDEIKQELSQDPKEIAEHVMLVDLARNDVGHACKVDSVSVKELMQIELYTHVMHMVSDVRGQLKEGCTAVDALKYGFPAGTVTGAPKVRAMEIIAELEDRQREFYSGGVVFFDFKGNLKSALAIRSICVVDKVAYTQAAGGIVADSIPEMEFKETENKMRSCLSAMAQCRDVS